MKSKMLLCIALALCLLLSACTHGGQEVSPVQTEDLASLTPEQVITELSCPECGGRAVGSTGNEAAAEYIADIFEALGLKPLFDTYLQPYDELVGYPERAEAKAALISADGTRTELIAGKDFYFYLPFSDLNVTLPVSADADACLDGKAIFYAEDYVDAVKYAREGAGRLSVSCGELKDRSNLMGLANESRSVYIELSEQYRETLRAAGTQLELSIRASAEMGTANNVAAVLHGSDGENAFLIGAHFDGSGLCGETLFPSAYDNASGTAAMLEIARLLCASGVELKNDVIFVAFNGEEEGRSGSIAFASAVTELYEQIDLINIDCVGNKNAGTSVYDEIGGNISLQEALLACLGENAVAGTDYASDQRSFSEYTNVSSVAVGDQDVMGSKYLHKTADTPDRVDGESVTGLAAAITEFLKADTLYTQQELTAADGEDDGLTDEERALRAQLNADGTLSKFGQVYVYVETKSGDHTAITGANRVMRSTAELTEACPATVFPEEILDYRFISANIQTILPESVFIGRTYGLTLSLASEYEAGKVYDFSGQLEANVVNALYRSDTGEGLLLYVNSIEGTQQDRESGATIDPLLEGYELEHQVTPEQGIDGYSRFYYCDERGVHITGWFVDATEAKPPVTGLEDWDENTWLPNRFLTAEEVTALLTSYDFRGLTAQIEPEHP